MTTPETNDLALLFQLANIPTAAGKEERVIREIKKWTEQRKNLKLHTDPHGNLILQQTNSESSTHDPLFLTAHLDHPAFVVRRTLQSGNIELEFRGGVRDNCFPKKEIEIFTDDDKPIRATILSLEKTEPFRTLIAKPATPDPNIKPGNIGRWLLSGIGASPEIQNNLFHAQACDDLAGVAAALSVLDHFRNQTGFKHVGVLLTRAEEIGFIGAIGAAKTESIPKNSRLICLEMSRSFPDSPIGAGPILRVGDFTGLFSRNLTNRFTQILRNFEKNNPSFQWQRKLMPGGTCEATAFTEFGYEAGCFCLPLGNYHNMTDMSLPADTPPTGGIAAEFISIDDYRGLLKTLILCIAEIDSDLPSLHPILENRFKHGKQLL